MTTNTQTSRREGENRYELRNRYVFGGLLVMQTAFHIGGGRVTTSNSDSPVVLTPDQKPFIPGSSFKGALRSAVEKIVPGLPAGANFTLCAMLVSCKMLITPGALVRLAVDPCHEATGTSGSQSGCTAS